MRDAVLLVLVLAAVYGGFAALALCQPRPWKRAIGEGVCPKQLVWRLRAAGYGLLALGFVLALQRDGLSFGALLWCVAVSIGAMAVAFTLTWRPAWLRGAAALFRLIGLKVDAKRPAAAARD
jgi:hypothetical protein